MPVRAHDALPLAKLSDALALRTLDLGSDDAGRQRPDNALCDLVLDGKNILKPAVVFVGPDVMTRRRVDELSGDAHAIANLAHAAFEHIAHAEFAASGPSTEPLATAELTH
jgi:hypothetical protein